MQRSVTEARTNVVQSVPAAEKARSASTDVGGITGAGTYSTDPAKAVPLFEVVRLAM